MEEEELPMPYIRALTSEIKETKNIITTAHNQMIERKQESKEYYEPATVLYHNVKKTRMEFEKKADEILELINKESKDLNKLKKVNEISIKELDAAAQMLAQAPDPEEDQPIKLAVRAVAVLFPFVTFALFSICSK